MPVQYSLRRRAAVAASNRWIILAAHCVTSGLLIGGLLVSLSVYGPYLLRAQGWSETTLGVAATASLVAMSVSSIVSGGLLQRLSFSTIIVAGAVLACMGAVAAAKSASETWFIVGFALAGLGVGTATMVPSIPSISILFSHDRGMALGVYFGAMSLACAVLPVVTRTMIEMVDWRFSLQTIGIVALVCAAAFVFLKPPSAPADKAPVTAGLPHAGGFSIKEALIAPRYWVFLLAMSLALLGVQGVLFGVVLFLVDGGMSPSTAIDVFSFVNLIAVPASPVLGIVADRIGARFVAPIGLLAQGIGTL